jgi:anaerobic magnesium-protoporphyrin IX monomethyl ester cyclase
MKVLLVSFFNPEAYGVRTIHSNLIHGNVDAYMLFFKINDNHGKSYSDRNKDDFKANLNNVSVHEIDILISHLKENKYDVVGFSLVSQNFNLYKKIYKNIKREIEHLIVVVGGWQVSLNPEKCINYTDFLCIGEGEAPLCELVDKLGKRESTDNIENIWVNRNGNVIKNQVRPLPKDLSSFPVPLFEHKYCHVIENNKIEHYDPYLNNNRYGTFIGRGCPYHCTYCSNSYMENSIYPKQWSKIRYRNVEHLQKELLMVKETLKHIKSINFYDEVFAPNINWMKDFFSWYKLVINIPFFVFFYPGKCNDEKAKILADSGLSGVWLGIQSGSQRVRNEVFKRRHSNGKILNQAKIFHKYCISVRYDFILDNPFETFEESLESIYMMLELPQPFSLNLFSLKYFPNTEITKMAKDAGFITEAEIDDNQEKDLDKYIIRQDKGITPDNKFINYLAFYISCISQTSISKDKKIEIIKLIDDYRRLRDITFVENMVKPFLL